MLCACAVVLFAIDDCCNFVILCICNCVAMSYKVYKPKALVLFWLGAMRVTINQKILQYLPYEVVPYKQAVGRTGNR